MPKEGLEPSLPKERDFESRASANSATSAHFDCTIFCTWWCCSAVSAILSVLQNRIYNMNEDKKIEVYSSPTCHYCVDLKKFLDEKGVQYTEYDVTTDEEKRKELLERSQQVGVPVMFINDTEMIDGFDKEKIVASLGLSD